MEEYCIYLRKSRADLEAEIHGEGETLARHEKALLELAKRLQLKVTKIYREVVSGDTIAARPIMQSLLMEIESGIWAGVLVMEIERLARGDTVDQGIVAQTFKYSDTKIITPVKIYDPNNEFDEEYFEFGLYMSRREYKTINRRLQRGRLASVKEGKYVGNKPPYGYKRVKIENDKGYTLAPIPEEAEIVRLIYDLYTTGELEPDRTHKRLGISLIARKLNVMKIPPKSNATWAPASVQEILTNPVYIGKVRWNWRPAVKKIADGQVKISRPRSSIEECIIVNGLHPPIIEESVWNKAQEYIKKNPPRPIGLNKTVKNPLAGLVICGKCGRRMIRRPYIHTPPSLMCVGDNCDNVSTALKNVEASILAELSKWVSGYRLKWGNKAQNRKTPHIDIKRKAISRIKNELTELKNQKINIHNLLEQGIYTAEVFFERSRFIATRIREVKESLEKLEHELTIESSHEKNINNSMQKIEELLEVYHRLPSAKAKNDMLKEILEKVIYTKDKRNTKWREQPDTLFKIDLYPKLPANPIGPNSEEIIS
ncbi:MAG: recombinase family protein [Clostridiales bacterium]|nr:recombinase family protein [Clostridiales bacterium]